MSNNFNKHCENGEIVLIAPYWINGKLVSCPNEFDVQRYEKELYNKCEKFRTFVNDVRAGKLYENAKDESLITLKEYFDLWEIKQAKIKKKKEREPNFVFITIQDYQRRLEDLDKLQIFIKRIEYLYSECHWIIEAGKSDPPNVHIHLLSKIINPRKHKQKLNLEWMKLFDTSLYDKDYYKITQWRKSDEMPTYEGWVEEKLIYFDDTKKGTHQNSVDLGISGSWGLL